MAHMEQELKILREELRQSTGHMSPPYELHVPPDTPGGSYLRYATVVNVPYEVDQYEEMEKDVLERRLIEQMPAFVVRGKR
ncbi:hypothetical protein H5410_046468 [Solanum commersonii]|uniref:Uncharacterized protein n=1 Tax=Solanum commersonii TaxID=4109 RepID=A0A9J5XEC2_SOLCO|nr:hypothetical protein H5410_046468 [Solanum commersonii]